MATNWLIGGKEIEEALTEGEYIQQLEYELAQAKANNIKMATGSLMLTQGYQLMKEALINIACYSEKYSWEKVQQEGSYRFFDEPGSVELAHKTLTELEDMWSTEGCQE